MESNPAGDRIPAHLRSYVAEQNYEAYSVEDQATWRFILLQTYDRLQHTAHPAYAQGLARAGMSVERIPRIEEMDRCLGEFGWGAVCVDGFIPPRAFQEFQALGLLPIAADIRTVEHLAYTPAPDIVHEAAGHAPILPDPTYAAFLRRFGEVGRRAFSLPHDTTVYEAIYRLSVVKERPDASPAEVEAAEQALRQARSAVSGQSEAGRLARLYWWTVEYGLVGTPDDYRLYGAGLLSSLGESHFCHDPKVEKLPLDLGCMQVDYDITRSQPQLFVCEGFDHLSDVLEQAADSLSLTQGGLDGLQVAQESGELATLELNTGAQIMGQVVEIEATEDGPSWVALAGPAALALEGGLLPDHGPDTHSAGYAFPMGRLSDGSDPSELDPSELRRRHGGTDGLVSLDLASGIRVRGLVHEALRGDAGRWAYLILRNCRITRGVEPLLETPLYALPLGTSVPSVFAGAATPAFHAPSPYEPKRLPAPRRYDAAKQELLRLYQEAQDSAHGDQAEEVFARVHERMRSDHPQEWLLRWNMLESLHKQGQGKALCRALIEDLKALEVRYGRLQPIETGLRYLGVD